MKKIAAVLLTAVLLTGCGQVQQPTVISEDDQMATRVAQILTTMPTATREPEISFPTQPLPTVIPTATSGATATPAASATSVPTVEVVIPSSTLEPTVSPTATLQPTIAYTPPVSDPTTKLGSPDWSDTMDNDNYWPTGADEFTDIAFVDGSMRLTGLTTTDGWRMTYPELKNFYIEAVFQVMDCSGADRYGLIARVPVLNTPDRGYLYGFTCDGKVSLRRWNASVGTKGEMVNLKEWSTSSAINAGPSQTNRMGLMAVGDRLILYANGQKIGEVQDGTFDSGYFGVFVGARETEDFTIRVDQIRVWENPEQ